LNLDEKLNLEENVPAAPVAHALMRAASPLMATPNGQHSTPSRPICELRSLGRLTYAEAFTLQQTLVTQRKLNQIPDQLLIVEHPHVITLGRNGHMTNLLASEEVLRRAGIDFHETDRGGDITYHGPGQIVGYPIFDLREWKRDVVAYVRALEQVLLDSLAEFGLEAGRIPGCTGVWIDGKKIAAIGVHISRWVTSHGFALNHTTDLSYFQYIVPCGITKPVTSLRALGAEPSREQVVSALARNFSKQFQRELIPCGPEREPAAAELTETY
jgi:lipoyl(octanoyl) transferase